MQQCLTDTGPMTEIVVNETLLTPSGVSCPVRETTPKNNPITAGP